ncbi:MAG: hypothetical protein C0408_07620 [Odoribacter sp.]|nr:hypothetical protein [Odoribacter sp.]
MKFEFKFFTSLCLLCCIVISLKAQEVVTSSGGYGITAGSKVSWTIGEPVTETAIGINNILTQGFNQGNLTITAIKKSDFPGVSLKVYPNPASDHLKIVVGEIDYANLRFVLFDINGKALLRNTITGIETDIPIGNLIPSTYLLKVYRNKTELTIFKIIKK